MNKNQSTIKVNIIFVLMKNARSYLFLVISLFLFNEVVNAQDIHFSQYYLSPLTQNPSLTGSFSELYRFSAIYRNQWYSVSNQPFQTGAISYDVALKEDKYILKGSTASEKNYFAYGGILFYDRSGLGKLSNLTIMGSGAYQLYLNKYNRLSFGLQAGISQRKIDYSQLLVNNQYNNGSGSFDPTLPSNESFNNNQILYANAHLGMGYTKSFKNQKNKLFVGAAYFNLLKPKESFLNTANQLQPRYTSYLAFDHYVDAKKYWRILVNFQTQNKAQEYNLGFLKSYKIASTTYFIWGTQMRLSLSNSNWDALIPHFGIKYANWRMGFSYDLNLSSLRKASQVQGGFEIALLYAFGSPKKYVFNLYGPFNSM